MALAQLCGLQLSVPCPLRSQSAIEIPAKHVYRCIEAWRAWRGGGTGCAALLSDLQIPLVIGTVRRWSQPWSIVAAFSGILQSEHHMPFVPAAFSAPLDTKTKQSKMMKRIGPDDGTPRCICELTWKYSVRSTGEMHVPLHGTRAKVPWMLPLNLLKLHIGRRKSCLTWSR